MDLIYTDENGIELGFISDSIVDIDIGDTNDFQITTTVENNILNYNYRFFKEQTEYGGIVTKRKVDTGANKIYYGGFTWRGILSKKILKPSQGENYYIVSGNLKNIINNMITRCNLNELFLVANELEEINISSYQFNRYTDFLTGVIKLLKSVNYRLDLKYSDGKVNIGYVKINDLSEELEFSQDGNVSFAIEDNRDYINHLICLGKGELADRQVIHLYVQADGSVGFNQYYYGINEIEGTFDYPNAETLGDLELSGRDKLKELLKSTKMQIKIEDIDVEIGDLVGGREYVTNTSIKREVTQKIIQIYDDVTNISYKVGE